jgi:hypothetical protein
VQALVTFRLVCKATAKTITAPSVAAWHGVQGGAYTLFSRRNSHGITPWVNLALVTGTWCSPCPVAVGSPPPLGRKSWWCIAQWSATRAFLHVAATGVVEAVLSLRRCAMVDPRVCCDGVAVGDLLCMSLTPTSGPTFTVKHKPPAAKLVVLEWAHTPRTSGPSFLK